MKKLACILIVALLFGCSVNSNDIKQDLTEELNLMAKHTPISYTTMNKPLYSYYLPKDIGKIDSNALSSLLIKDGTKFIMNFNPNGIVIHDYYHKTEAAKQYEEPIIQEDSELYYRATGTFLGSDYRYHEYTLRIMKLDEEDFLLYFDMEYVNYIAIVKEVQLESFVHSMLIMTKSLQYNSTRVVAEYSLQSTSDSIKEDLEEFNDELPNDGSLSDLINESNK